MANRIVEAYDEGKIEEVMTMELTKCQTLCEPDLVNIKLRLDGS